jgi:protein-S-isoprenylcysteine O-methyltransferase Ste14
MYEVLFDIVCYAALARSSWLLVGLARIIPVHLRARTRRWGVAELLAIGELFAFLALTWLLFTSPPAVPRENAPSWLAAAVGATASVAGVVVSVWAIYTTTRIGVILDGGHFVKQEHPLITTGAYGFVRNPMYLGILLLWFGIAVAFQHWLLLLLATGYVVPVFLLYIRNEDRMLVAEFGAPYEEYRQRVGSLLPRRHRSRA